MNVYTYIYEINKWINTWNNYIRKKYDKIAYENWIEIEWKYHTLVAERKDVTWEDFGVSIMGWPTGKNKK